jgi:type IV secretion system protein TrbL
VEVIMLRSRTARNIITLGLVAAAACLAQRPDAPSAILNAYRAERTTWFGNVWPAANTLFGLLAIIDFAWSAAGMVLERQDFHGWLAALIRKIMTIGAFYALLIYGRWWIPAIIDSFEFLGQRAAGSGPLDPGDVFTRGLNVAGALIDGASNAGILTNFGASLALVFASVMSLLGFLAVAIQFVVALVESYILVAGAFIFLGFGGSRWSAPYVERYIALAVAIGVKIMVLYLLIGTGMDVSLQWLTDAENVSTAAKPATAAFSIMGGSLIFTMLCWQAPKLIAGILGASPHLSGGDLVSTVGTIGAGAMVLGSAAFAAAGGAATAIRGAAAGGGGGGAAGASAIGAGAAPPPPPPPAGAGGSAAAQPAPPSSAGGAGLKPPSPMPGNGTARNSRSRFANFRLPPDAAPQAAPPRFNIHHHDD